MDNVIDLARLWRIVRNNFGKIIVLGLIFGAVSFGISKFIIPAKYASSASLLVNQSKDSNTTVQYADQQADVQMINTYKDIITRPIILDKVVQNLTENQKTLVSKATSDQYKTLYDGTRVLETAGKAAVYDTKTAKYPHIGLTASSLTKMITIQNQTNSQIFTITVTSTNGALSRDAANEVANVFKSQIANIMSVQNVSIVSSASEAKSPVAPNIKLLTGAGILAGLIVGFLWGAILEISDRSVKSVDYITDEMGLINLGVVEYANKIRPVSEVLKEHDKNNKKKGSDTLSRLGRRI